MVAATSSKPSWAGMFQTLGARFVTAPEALQKKLSRIRALIFDWDGVFNAGQKGEGVTSHFTEPDSMGSNMLRFGLWLPQRRMPIVAVITGVDNSTFISPCGDQPDIIVRESGYRGDREFRHSRLRYVPGRLKAALRPADFNKSEPGETTRASKPPGE